MTLAVVCNASTAGNTTPQTPLYPTTVAGAWIFCTVWNHPITANDGTAPTMPAGWTLVASMTGANDGNTGGFGSTTTADEGNANLWIYLRDTAASGSEGGSTISITFPDSSPQGAAIWSVSSNVSYGSLAYATGKQATNPTTTLALSATSDPGVAADDMLVAFWALPSDNPTYTAYSLTQAGVTFGTATELRRWSTNQGNDGECTSAWAIASAGPSSGNPVLGLTLNAGPPYARGPAIFIRLSETSSGGFDDLTGDDLTGSAPTLTAGSLSQAHALASAVLLTPAPTLTAGALTQVHALASAALLTGAPTLTAGALSQLHALASAALLTPAPTLTAGALTQHHALSSADLVTGAPTLTAGSLAGHVDLAGDSILTGAPTLTAGSLSQHHALASAALTTPAPLITAGSLSQHHALSSGNLVTGTPFLTAGSLGGEIDTTFTFISATTRDQPLTFVSTTTRDQPIVLVSIGE